MGKIKPLLIVAGVFLLILIADLYGFARVFNLEALRQHQKEIGEFVDNNHVTAPLTYIGVFIASSVFCLPVAAALILLAGFLFPQPLSTFCVLIGATAGATSLYFLAKSALGRILFKKTAGEKLAKFEKGFQKNAVSYLLFMRFVPIFPFWFVNIAPALFQVPLRTFAWTTFVGILPETIFLTQAGSGLSSVLQSGNPLTLSTILNPEMKIALILLGAFALIPIWIRKKLK